MDRLVLASAPFELALPRALSRILPGTRAIIVTRKSDAPILVTASDILDKINDVQDAGGDPEKVPVGECSTHLVSTPAKAHPLDDSFSLPNARILNVTEQTHYGRVFGGNAWERENGDRFAIQHLSKTAAIVVTASEDFAAALGSALIICRCAGNPVHRFERRKLRVPGQCNKAHKAPVTCAAAP
jgi:hypothetical protein